MRAHLLVPLSLYNFMVLLLVFMTQTRLGAWLFPFIDDQHPLTHLPWCHQPYGSGQQGRGCPSCLVLRAARCSQSAASSGLVGRLCPIPARPGPQVLPAELAWQQHCGAGLLQGSVPSPFTGCVWWGHLQGWGAGGSCGLPPALSRWALEAAGPVSHQFRLFPWQRCPSVRPGPTPPGPGRRNPLAVRGSRC